MRIEYSVVYEYFDGETGAVDFDIIHDFGEQLDLAQAKEEVDQSLYKRALLVAYVYDTDASGEEDIVHSFTLYPREDVYDTYEATLGWWDGGMTDVHHVKLAKTHYWHYYRFVDLRPYEIVNTPYVLVIEEIDGEFFVDRFVTTDDETWQAFISYDMSGQEN